MGFKAKIVFLGLLKVITLLLTVQEFPSLMGDELQLTGRRPLSHIPHSLAIVESTYVLIDLVYLYILGIIKYKSASRQQ